MLCSITLHSGLSIIGQNGDLTDYINEGNVFVIPFCIDDNGSSGDEILHPFETDMFESIHKPDDDQSSDDEILHPFEPNMFQSIHKPDDQSSDNEILHPFEPGSLDEFDDSDDEKTIHEPKGGEFEGSSGFDSSFASSSEDNMQTLSENEDGNDGTDTPEHMNPPTESGFYFIFLQWVCILFVCTQHKFGITGAAANVILAFISLILGVLTHPLHSHFPKNLPGVLRIASIDTFVERTVYVVCPNDSCNALYSLSELISNAETASMTHSAQSFRKTCGYKLCFRKQLAFGRWKWTPYKTFSFIHPSIWLQKMYANSKFVSLLDDHLKRH